MLRELDVTVCIPWRPQPHRVWAFEQVLNWWESRGFVVVTGDSEHEHFNISAARNAAVDAAGTDRVIVADADTVPMLESILTALTMPGVVWPFETYRHLGDNRPNADDVASSPFDRDQIYSVGGIFVTTKDTYWQLGGMDERFTRWGYEDTAFRRAVQTLSVMHRTDGYVYAYGHDADRDLTTENPGWGRVQLYAAAEGYPELMRELIAGNRDRELV